jgi:hypothetical protein
MPLFSDSLTGWPKRQRLCLALSVSLVLHLGGLALLQLTRGEAK